nr:hypothetical protein [uncultured Desulfosarcina sp.]
MPGVQRGAAADRMNSVQKKTQALFFVNTNNNRKGINQKSQNRTAVLKKT